MTAKGVCWDTLINPTIANNKTNDGNNTGGYGSYITGLIPNKTYYVRAYAINSVGTAYGNQIHFTTILSNTVTDIDGNVYHTVQIGSQIWMVENLKTTKYRNGESIPNVTDNSNWGNLKTGAYCVYDNNTDNAVTYGCLYNWYAVNDIRNIAPVGWHVASDFEWRTLTNNLGGDSIAGGKLKESGIVH